MGLTQKLGTIPLAILTDSSNNVGIGAAANASFKLQVTGASLFTDGTQGLNIRAYTGGAGFGAIYSSGVTAGAGNFALAASSTQTILSGVDSVNLAINSAIKLAIASTGAATFSSSVTANGLYANAGNSARFYRSANDYYWGINNDSNNYLNFGTFAANGTAYGTNPKMILLDNGNVGIGTSSPQAGLEVVTESGAFNALRLVSNRAQSSGTDVAIMFRYLSDSSNYVNGGLIVVGKDNTTSGSQLGNMQFYTNGGSGIVERMRITSGGYVGIGTGTPASLLTLYRNANEDNIFSIYQGTVGYATAIKLIGANDDGAKYNYISSNTNGGTIHWQIGGGAVANTMVFYTNNNTERMRISSGGNLYLGVSSSVYSTAAKFEIQYSGAAVYGMNMRTTTGDAIHLNFVNQSGSQVGYIYSNNTNTQYTTSSDYRLKQDLKEFNGLKLISNIKTYDYEWKSDKSRMYGVIAHELQEFLPQAVSGEKDGDRMQGVDYSMIVPILVKAIQELTQKVNALENK